MKFLKDVLKERGITDQEAWVQKNQDEISTFCKNANFLQVTKGRSFAHDLKNYEAPDEFGWELHEPEEGHLWYIVTKCVEEFRAEKGYYAGMLTEDDSNHLSAEAKQRAADELEDLKARVDVYVKKSTPDQKADDRYIKEMIRFADSKIHTVSAFLGGIAS